MTTDAHKRSGLFSTLLLFSLQNMHTHHLFFATKLGSYLGLI